MQKKLNAKILGA